VTCAYVPSTTRNVYALMTTLLSEDVSAHNVKPIVRVHARTDDAEYVVLFACWRVICVVRNLIYKVDECSLNDAASIVVKRRAPSKSSSGDRRKKGSSLHRDDVSSRTSSSSSTSKKSHLGSLKREKDAPASLTSSSKKKRKPSGAACHTSRICERTVTGRDDSESDTTERKSSDADVDDAANNRSLFAHQTLLGCLLMV
jgi:hypothetical protein